jgi:hypothetical protein
MEEESLSIKKAPSSPKQKESSPRKMAGATPSPGCESPVLHAVAPEPRAGSTSPPKIGFDSSTHLIDSLRELELDSEDEPPSPTARIESRYGLRRSHVDLAGAGRVSLANLPL